MIIAPPLFNRMISPYFLRMISPYVSYLCMTRGGPPKVECDQDGYDRVDPSPRDHQISMCVILRLSEMLDGRHMASSGASARHRSRSSSSGVDSNPMVRSSSHRGGLVIARSSLDGRDRS